MKLKRMMSAGVALALTTTLVAANTADATDARQSNSDKVLALNLRFNRLPVLGDSLVYEGWIIVDGQPITTGRFTVDEYGNYIDEATGNVSRRGKIRLPDNPDVSDFVLTIEPFDDPDPAPADTHILAGNFGDHNRTRLNVDHPAAFGQDFSDASGSFILATPSNGDGDPLDERSGVWFLDPNGPSPSLDLPTLTPGWQYEGWAVVDGVPITTGKFLDPSGPDDFNGFSGDQGTPPFPGEDFLNNAPDGVEFPLDLRGSTIAITVEPFPDDSPAPFNIKPLFGKVRNNAQDHQSIELNRSGRNPTGTAWLSGGY